ncbi:MAG: response regulator [Kofleriaceae bacterium]|jgi:signal transduction histidine kinase/CheY-like chemotaxis protein|nr:response regulator [Kofleriaceae bacterium]MBP6838025.1 response regulator [Kofleriaceae bacterium]MBP9204024.1 response regulator [Kofleriaceae bacterium]
MHDPSLHAALHNADALRVRVRFGALGFGGASTAIPIALLLLGRAEVLWAGLAFHLVVVALAVVGLTRATTQWSIRSFTLWCTAMWMAQIGALFAESAAGSTTAIFGLCLELIAGAGVQVMLAPLVAGVVVVCVAVGVMVAAGQLHGDAVLPIIGAVSVAVMAFLGFRLYTRRVTDLLRDQQRLHAEAIAAQARLAAELDERHRAEAERELLRESFLQSQKMEAVGRLAGGVAHDVNNVIAAIRGLAEVMLPEAPAELHEDLGSIIQSCDRGADLTKNLLGFSRRGPSTHEVFDAAEVIGDVARLLGRTAPRGIALESSRTIGARVEGDKSQLTHALLNLCINAIDAMGQHGQLTLEVGPATLDPARAERLAMSTGEAVRIVVRDTGSGMDPATLARLFEPFFTTKALGKGTGLGLSMVQATVKAHGGGIEVDSAPGQGTTMTVWLPRVMTEALPAVVMASAGSGPIPTGGAGRKGTVLIIDDDPLVRSFMQRLVRGQGCDVLVAERAEEGVELAKARPGAIAAVILDMQMPGMGGAEGFRVLHALQPTMPVILVSGYAEQRDVQRCLSEGAMTFLQKPFDVQLLRSALDQAITQSEAS